MWCCSTTLSDLVTIMSVKSFDDLQHLYPTERANIQTPHAKKGDFGKVNARTLFCYGVGHFLNDMTAACWFNYLLVFLIQVQHNTPAHAGIIMLSGQIGDAIATPLVGIFSDKTKSRFGRRKTWLAGGALIVNVAFFFVFSDCYLCHLVPGRWFRVVYWSFLAATFNFGWAAVQVSHMALVPELTSDESERVQLNSARYAGGITATLMVLGIAWGAIAHYGICRNAFQVLSLSSIGIGNIFTLIFLFGVKEDLDGYLLSQSYASLSANVKLSRPKIKTWYHWFKVPMFYQVGVVYMCARITVNISQVFMPFFLEFYLNLEDKHTSIVAEVPLVVMITSFTTTFFLKKVNKFLGRRSTFTAGAAFVLAGLCGLWWFPPSMWGFVFISAFFLGVGTTTVLVTSISMEADLIGGSVQTGAFVYGALSFTDKLSNGILIEFTSQYTKNPELLRYVICWIPGLACVVGAITSFTIVYYYRNPQKKQDSADSASGEEQTSLLHGDSS